MRIKYFLIIILTISPDIFPQWITNHDPIPQPDIPKPASGNNFTEPSFGTSVVRITDAVNFSNPGFFPQYSKRQAWNSDESKMILTSDNGSIYLFDGNTYSFIKELPGLWGEDIFWHPVNSGQIIFSADNAVCSYNINTEEVTQLKVFPEYTWVNTRGEGNLSRDAEYYAFVGQTYDTDTHFKDLVVYDINQNSVISTLALPEQLNDFDWVSISPFGNYVVVDYATAETGRFNGVEVYDRNFNFIWQKPLGAGHSDLTVDSSGDEVLVMDYYDENSNSVFVKKFRLSDGQETSLIEFSWQFDSHISCRNELRSEWCFISTFDGEGRLTHDVNSWLPFEDEIFALKLDGSGEVQRIAHHHSRRFSPEHPDRDNSVYWAEPHATVSRKGTKILFGSNWSENIGDVSSVDAYIADMSSMPNEIEINHSFPEDYFLYQNYPNPFNAATIISYYVGAGLLQAAGNAELIIYDVLGKEVKSLVNGFRYPGRYSVQFDASELASGMYFYRLRIKDFTDTKKMILLR